MVAPVRERGLKLSCQVVHCKSLKVAPVRERGLKSVYLNCKVNLFKSLP